MANTVAKAPPYPKVKFSDAKFREIIPTLPLAECMKVQYKAKGVWFRMISKYGNFYNCECCGIDNVGPTPIVEHLRGKKHRLALQIADKLFHPQYTAPKPTNSPPRTPINDALISAGKPPNTNIPKNKYEPVTKQASASAQKQTVNASKPGPASMQKAKPDGNNAKTSGTETKTAPFQKPGPASSKKPLNANAANATKANEASANAKKETPPVSEAKETTAVSKTKETPAASESKDLDSKESTADESKDEKPKSGEVEKPKESIGTGEEIVILDDEEEDTSVEKNKTSEPSIKSEVENLSNEVKPDPILEAAKPKEQRPQKRKQQQEKTDDENQSANRVLNPAAVLAQAAEKQNNYEKPRYQQNRVITPSANKKKESPNEKPPAQQPSFSKKIFSPNESGDYEGIIGVEYVVKILKVYNDPEPFYECCLCEVVMDGIGMQTHLLGYNHRYKFIEKHFPTCFNLHRQHIGNIQVMGIILDRIAKAIESHHGRELPYECLSGEFRANRHGVMTTVYSFRHASEYSGPSFTHVISAKEVEDLYKNKVVFVPPKADPKRKPTFDTRGGGPVPKRGRMDRERERGRERDRERPYLSGRGNIDVEGNYSNRRPYRMTEPETENTVDDATHKLLVEEFLNHTRGKSRSPSLRRRRHRSRSRSPIRAQRRRSVSPLREGDIWQAYRHLVDRSKYDLDQLYKEYRKDPEKHPVYDEEWRKFWKHRKEQLAREGLDHRNYDFQPEWVRYFAVRIEELYDEAVEDIKISSRRRLILPMTNDELQDKKYHVRSPRIDLNEQQGYEQRNEELINKSDNLPFRESTKKTSVVSVLRLLTALEDYLGSLGPKVVDLLSRALLVEKTNPREINEIILNLENCTILETAMEKLKGVLIAGLLEGPKVKAFNNVITETDKILKIAYRIRRENPHSVGMNRPMPVPAPKIMQQEFSRKSFSPQRQNPMNPNGGNTAGAAVGLLSQIDKKELATKLAAALTAQGKTDFNPEQLQQLIAVYSLIDKKKRDSAAASDKQKMTLSDTLTALLNPSAAKAGDGHGNLPTANRMGVGARDGAGDRNFSSNSDKFASMNNSSITNFVTMLNRDSGPTGNNGNDPDMWQNLQNIQNSLRLQNNANNSVNAGRGFGNNNSMGGNSGGNFNNRSGLGGQSEQNFNRGEFSGGNNNHMDDFEAGYRSGYQGMNNSNPSNTGVNAPRNAIGGPGGVGKDMMDMGERDVNNMVNRNRGGMKDMMSGGRGGGGGGGGQQQQQQQQQQIGNNNNFSGMGNNYSTRGTTGTGANNTLGFARNSFLGSGSSNIFSGLSNFSTSITSGNYNRGGNSNKFSGGGNFNNQQMNNPGGQNFASAPNQRNMGGNQMNSNNQGPRSGGSNWRSQ